MEKTIQQGAFDLYSSPNIIRVIKGTRLMWNGHVARIGERCIQGFGEKTLRKGENLEDPGVDGRLR